MSESKLVSVIIPTYNRAGVLEKSVRSVLDQTWRDLECIVVDDGSTDGTERVVKAIGDSRLRFVYQENAGACAARNRGIREAGGDWIAFHDSDDTWRREKLEKQMAVVERMKPDIVICKLMMHRPDGSEILYPKRIPEGFVLPEDDLFGVGTQTILARRDVAERNLFDPSFPRYQDLEWLIRAVKAWRIYCLDEALVDYEVGADSISANPEKMFAALKMIAEKYPGLSRDCPALSMHIVRNLLGEWSAFRPVARGRESEYRALVFRFFPGLIRYGAARWKGRRRAAAGEEGK